MIDPIVAEVRKAREEYARQFNYDLHAMCEDLRRNKTCPAVRSCRFPEEPGA